MSAEIIEAFVPCIYLFMVLSIQWMPNAKLIGGIHANGFGYVIFKYILTIGTFMFKFQSYCLFIILA